MRSLAVSLFFLCDSTTTTEIYTLSLHDALPIFLGGLAEVEVVGLRPLVEEPAEPTSDRLVHGGHVVLAVETADHEPPVDRKSTRLNSSHVEISYAVFCLKKKKSNNTSLRLRE